MTDEELKKEFEKLHSHITAEFWMILFIITLQWTLTMAYILHRT